MSLSHEATITCRFCRQRIVFTCHDSINVGIDPDDKEKVLDGSIFQCHCRHCGKSDMVCHPVLYHDPELQLMIQVLWDEEKFGYPMDEVTKALIKSLGRTHYRRREVFGYRELTEKIRIFDANLDDFAIALFETTFQIRNPELQLFFSRKEEDGLYFFHVRNEEILPEHTSLEMEGYKLASVLAEKLKRPQVDFAYLRVDESYFYDNIVEIMQQEEK